MQNTPFDPYNFSEIEKIQSDIEKDLGTDLTITPETGYELIIPKPLPPTFTQDNPVQQPVSTSYRRMVVALLLICTLGTGTFGVGMGIGVATWQQRTSASGQNAGDVQNDLSSSPAVGSSRLVFDSETTANAGTGTLADVVRLVEPTVVRVSPTRQSNIAPFPFAIDSGNQGNGSGIIFKVDDGRVYIVTSDYVIRGADSVTVSIMESDPILANFVGRSNTSSDLAIIYVNLNDVHDAGIRNLTIATFGDSDDMRVGDVVLAIGNAMGEGNATTSGIISAQEKEIRYGERTMRLLQTDAAINPGTGGGPLVNKQGKVIGINTLAGSTDHYAIEGMGFSIPSNVAMQIIEQIMNQGPRPFLGINPHHLDEQIAAHLGIPPIGVFVYGIVPDTGASRAGMRQGDVITSFNGRAILNVDNLLSEIGGANVGDTVEIMIIRGREQIVLNVTLTENIHETF